MNEIQNQSNQMSSFIASKGNVSIIGKKRKSNENNVEKSAKKQKTSENPSNSNISVFSKKQKSHEENTRNSPKRRKTTETSELFSLIGLILG